LIKIALPKGDLQDSVRQFLSERGIEFAGYHKDVRAYASRIRDAQGLFSKQFREKDIPIQVSIGNYDLGLCGTQWVAEYVRQYPRSNLLTLRTLDISEGEMCICCAAGEAEGKEGEDLLGDLARRGPIRIATEFPSLAEEFALKKRLPDFRIFPLWGAAEAYPPEGAELILISIRDQAIIERNNLSILERLFPVRVCMIANKSHFEKKDLTSLLDKLV
jgi:ATP phosphoribosyltransferase